MVVLTNVFIIVYRLKQELVFGKKNERRTSLFLDTLSNNEEYRMKKFDWFRPANSNTNLS